MNQTAPNKAVFLDRDGVLNAEIGDYVCRLEDFEVLPGVPEALQLLHDAGYYLIVVTNQAGIAKGLYPHEHVHACHQKLQAATNNLIDAFYYAPSHPSVSESLSRKPGSLMLERAIARFLLDPTQCWMVGDRGRDLEAAARVGIRGILVSEAAGFQHEPHLADLPAAAAYILQHDTKAAAR
jgi:D-glycero-D-manno-heptose 1,7-bisphosphate phosphatase